MNKEKNIYNFKAPKSSNEEVNFFNIKGRINRNAFFVRLLLVIAIYFLFLVLFNSGFHKNFGFRFENFYETIHIFIFPLIFSLFVLIQGAKRMHDINKSGWNFLIPFYNLYLASLPGTKGNNDYGIDYNTAKNITYFDEVEVVGKSETTSRKVKSSRKKPNATDLPESKSNLKSYTYILIILVAVSAWYNTQKNKSTPPINITADSTSIDTTVIVKDSAAPASSFNDSDVIDTLADKNNIIWLNEINGYFIDERDENKYEVVKVGKQIWMADNLRYRSDESVSLKCDDSNDKYGRLYNWDDAKEVAPKGWHLPTKKEYDQLIRNLSESEILDSNYFNAYSSGQAFLGTERCLDQSPQFDESINYWSATPYGNEVAWALQYYDTGFLMTWSNSYRKGRIENGCYYGVRCVLDQKKIKINW
jgi:uncharacterized protein (TIGR02145 family)